MSNYDFIQHLCGTWCSYYTPGKDEALACQGFVVAKQLMLEKNIFPSEHPDTSDVVMQLRSKRAAQLKATLCPACSFSVEDCDFADRLEGAQPCGGFLLLMQLVKKKSVSIDDIKRLL